jgi:hypothetical protein
MEKQNLIWLTLSILFLAGTAALWLRQRIRLKRARSWPTETGRVESTTIELKQSSTGPSGATTSSYVASVQYSYNVRCEYYSGVLRHNFMLESRAKKWTDKFTTGLSLQVRCNPANPKDSVLFEDEQVAMAA